jgi:dethiobiotin synthetase
MHGKQAYFLTGTDTEVGKTFAACALLHAARRQGLSTLGMKPVAAGVDGRGLNQDVEQLIAASSVKAPRNLVNPCHFAAPIAPHIAAADERRVVDIDNLRTAFDRLATLADFIVVEGVGGFRVPLGESIDTADLVRALDLPVILVVGLRLGCLNHALLTAEAIRARGLGLAGWIANRIDPAMGRWQENIAALDSRLAAPLLGVLPWSETPDPRLAGEALKPP